MYTLLLLVHWHCVTATTNVLHRFSSPPFISFYPPLFSLLFFIHLPSFRSEPFDRRSFRIPATLEYIVSITTLLFTIVLVQRIQRRDLSKRFQRSCNIQRRRIAIGRLENTVFHPSRVLLLYFFSLFSICSNERSRFVFASKEPILRSRLAEITSLKNEYKKMKNRWLGDHSER